mmetsp:Transcript_5532/g.17942  ORF Transcript_5532/g.17942 Transcript_5532/m.17942 type:complete len:259 (+) Transcript_5532:548-1324(+)
MDRHMSTDCEKDLRIGARRCAARLSGSRTSSAVTGHGPSPDPVRMDTCRTSDGWRNCRRAPLASLAPPSETDAAITSETRVAVRSAGARSSRLTDELDPATRRRIGPARDSCPAMTCMSSSPRWSPASTTMTRPFTSRWHAPAGRAASVSPARSVWKIHRRTTSRPSGLGRPASALATASRSAAASASSVMTGAVASSSSAAAAAAAAVDAARVAPSTVPSPAMRRRNARSVWAGAPGKAAATAATARAAGESRSAPL